MPTEKLRQHRRPDDGLPPVEPEELRIAAVMTGGVSLAVWMGGVTYEISRLLAGAPGYGQLCRALSTLPSVDVVAGTSAGGVNGAVLAMATARNADIGALRDIWFDEGSLADLLRAPTHKDPLSLMKGDEKLFTGIIRGLRRVADTARPPADSAMPPGDITLLITGTLLQGESRSITDDYGTVISDVDHRLLFSFDRTDLTSESGLQEIALAARTTASFPGAFEASFVPVGQPVRATRDVPNRPDMADRVTATKSRWAIDGGVLVNKPLGPALKAIFARRADTSVRRILAYIVPDPGGRPPGDPDAFIDPPGMRDVLFGAVTIPQAQSISADLDALHDHNARIDRTRGGRVHLARLIDDSPVEDAAVWTDYTKHWAAAAAQEVLAEITRQITALRDRQGLPTEWKPTFEFYLAGYERRLTALTAALVEDLPAAAPSTLDLPGTAYKLGHRPLQAAASITLDVLRRVLAATSSDQILLQAVGRVHTAKQLKIIDLESQVRVLLEPLRAGLALPRPTYEQWLDAGLEQWRLNSRLDPDDVWQRWSDMAGALITARDRLAELDVVVPPSVDKLVAALAPSYASIDMVAERLLRLHVYEAVLGGASSLPEQRVQLIQMSAASRNGLDDRKLPSEKLTGLQLHHFGAFYKRSWRANDWMWGRLDGAGWLVHVLLNPRRLVDVRRLSGLDNPEFRQRLMAELEAVACGEGEAAEAALRPLWASARAAVEEELTQLDNPDGLPKSLPNTAVAVARGIQLGILITELPALRRQIDIDLGLGASGRRSLAFRTEYDARTRSSELTPQNALDLLRICDIPAETLDDEVGSDLLTYVVSTAAATGMAAAGGVLKKLPGPLKPALRVAQLGTLWLYFLTRAALQRSRTSFALLVLMVAAPAVVLAAGPSGRWRDVSLAVLIAALLYVTVRLPKSVRQGVRVFFVSAPLAVLAWMVFAPSRLPSWTGLRDWPTRLASTLSADGARGLKYSVVAIAVLVICRLGFNWLAGWRHPMKGARGVRRWRLYRMAAANSAHSTLERFRLRASVARARLQGRPMDSTREGDVRVGQTMAVLVDDLQQRGAKLALASLDEPRYEVLIPSPRGEPMMHGLTLEPTRVIIDLTLVPARQVLLADLGRVLGETPTTSGDKLVISLDQLENARVRTDVVEVLLSRR